MRRIVIVLFLLSVIFVKYYLTRPVFTTGDKLRISSTVLTQPVNFEKSQYFKLLGLKIYLPLYPAVSYGDKVVVEGIVNEDSLEKPILVSITVNENLIYKIRKNLLDVYKKSLPSDEYALVSGVTIGAKSGISTDFWEKLKKSGTAHVVVASGMNVTLVAAFLMSFAVSFINRRLAIYFVIGGIWIYALISGFDAPIVRAALMGTIAFIAQETGRLNDTVKAVFVSGYLMLFVNPAWIKDIGFLLSFCATLSLILFSKRVAAVTSKIKVTKNIPRMFKEALDTTISAQIGILPIMFVTFGSYNPFSILANSLTLWTIPIITIFGFVGGVLGLIYLPVGTLVLLIVYPLARYFLFIVDVFS